MSHEGVDVSCGGTTHGWDKVGTRGGAGQWDKKVEQRARHEDGTRGRDLRVGMEVGHGGTEGCKWMGQTEKGLGQERGAYACGAQRCGAWSDLQE